MSPCNVNGGMIMQWITGLGERLAAPFLYLGAVWDLLWGRSYDDYQDLPRNEHPYFNQ